MGQVWFVAGSGNRAKREGEHSAAVGWRVVTRAKLMGWKLCGDKKERGLMRDRRQGWETVEKKGLGGRNINISYCV